MKEVAGVNLGDLVEPLRYALNVYKNMSDGQLNFDIDDASKLQLTPDKPNSARSAVEVRTADEVIGKLFVIAFKPFDGTGDESAHLLSELTVAKGYPAASKIVPRDKSGIAREVLLTVLTKEVESKHTDPKIFNGLFELLGIESKLIKKIGTLGQEAESETKNQILPTATYTVENSPNVAMLKRRRFGDPHAVYNSNPDRLQVAAFFAVSDIVEQKYPDLLLGLQPKPARRS